MGAPPVQPGKQTPRPGPAQPGAPPIGRGKTPPTGQMEAMTLSSPTTGTQPTTTKTPSTSEASQSKQASTVPSAVPTQSAPSGNPIRDAGLIFSNHEVFLTPILSGLRNYLFFKRPSTFSEVGFSFSLGTYTNFFFLLNFLYKI